MPAPLTSLVPVVNLVPSKQDDETESPLHEATKPDPPKAARASIRKSAVAQTPRDQETGLGDIELREAVPDFDERHVYAGRPSVFSGEQVAGRGARNFTLGNDEADPRPRVPINDLL